MKYEQIWLAVDKLAKLNNLSTSGLAKKAGLDSTSFNKSKRIRKDGQQRWPSMESINKILTVCNCDFEDFYKLGMSEELTIKRNNTPFCNIDELAEKHMLNENGVININQWSEINFPEIDSGNVAVEVNNNKYLPIYNDGDVLIVNTKCEIRKSDKVIIKDKKNNVDILEFIRRTSDSVEFKSINSEQRRTVKLFDIEWIKRIIWSSQ